LLDGLALPLHHYGNIGTKRILTWFCATHRAYGGHAEKYWSGSVRSQQLHKLDAKSRQSLLNLPWPRSGELVLSAEINAS
jgi:hypothetical protein